MDVSALRSRSDALRLAHFLPMAVLTKVRTIVPAMTAPTYHYHIVRLQHLHRDTVEVTVLEEAGEGRRYTLEQILWEGFVECTGLILWAPNWVASHLLHVTASCLEVWDYTPAVDVLLHRKMTDFTVTQPTPRRLDVSLRDLLSRMPLVHYFKVPCENFTDYDSWKRVIVDFVQARGMPFLQLTMMLFGKEESVRCVAISSEDEELLYCELECVPL